ncbi:MAG: flagellar export chaperone FliS [Firmicutes bacterium]|nr:flagellar export chaperone FliS [Bacillota bacterium]
MGLDAYQIYKKTQVSTASQGELVVMMFDGAIKFSNQAKEMINQSKIAEAHEKLIRAQDIVSELSAALNMDTGEIAKNLYQLYDYINNLLVQANIKKDVEILDQAIQLLTELRDTWRQVVAKVQ